MQVSRSGSLLVSAIDRTVFISPLPKGSGLRKIKEWDCSEFARRIGPVLSRIEQAEQEPRLLPHVQKAWEIRTGP